MKIQFKKLVSNAITPRFGKPGDAGADLVATSLDLSRDGQVVYSTGIAVEIPEGMVGLVFPRSSIRDKDLVLSNGVGVIDSGYRGEIMATFNLKNPWSEIYNVGDRIAQLVVYKLLEPIISWTEAKDETSRGDKGFGSSGR